jgi:hypothetical protein
MHSSILRRILAQFHDTLFFPALLQILHFDLLIGRNAHLGRQNWYRTSLYIYILSIWLFICFFPCPYISGGSKNLKKKKGWGGLQKQEAHFEVAKYLR